MESKCYMPDKKSDIMNELTESYVWDYTFRIMCLYTDFIDRIIRWQGLVPLITHNYPTGIGERSGYKSVNLNKLMSGNILLSNFAKTLRGKLLFPLLNCMKVSLQYFWCTMVLDFLESLSFTLALVNI